MPIVQSKSLPAVYAAVRTDLPFAQQVVQIGHACLLAGVRFGCGETRLIAL